MVFRIIVISLRPFISLEPASLPPCTRCSKVYSQFDDGSCTHTILPVQRECRGL